MEEKFVKMIDKISCKTDERPRMSLDMVGDCILILLDRKSGNIGRLFYDFVMRIKAKILCRCVYVGTEKENEYLFVVVSKQHFVDRGSLDRTEDNQLTPDPWIKLSSHHGVQPAPMAQRFEA